jgi:hypothetical protein
MNSRQIFAKEDSIASAMGDSHPKVDKDVPAIKVTVRATLIHRTLNNDLEGRAD